MSMTKTTVSLNEERVAKVKAYVRSHYGDDLTLAVLADLVSLVPTSLCHVFKRMTGTTVTDYLNDVRIEHAAKLLAETDMEIKAIAYDCGYSTQTNFNRQFKRHKGCTPGECRTLMRNKKEQNNQ